jgi:hypothetical protein
VKKRSAMKSPAIVLSLVISTIVLPSGFAPASASKMDGKCCPSSDGGRSYRYRMAMKRAAVPHTCTAYAASCMRNSSAQPDGAQMCGAARSQCLQSGVYVGPYSGRHYAGMQKM